MLHGPVDKARQLFVPHGFPYRMCRFHEKCQASVFIEKITVSGLETAVRSQVFEGSEQRGGKHERVAKQHPARKHSLKRKHRSPYPVESRRHRIGISHGFHPCIIGNVKVSRHILHDKAGDVHYPGHIGPQYDRTDMFPAVFPSSASRIFAHKERRGRIGGIHEHVFIGTCRMHPVGFPWGYRHHDHICRTDIGIGFAYAGVFILSRQEGGNILLGLHSGGQDGEKGDYRAHQKPQDTLVHAQIIVYFQYRLFHASLPYFPETDRLPPLFPNVFRSRYRSIDGYP